MSENIRTVQVFISYADENQKIAMRLYNDLDMAGANPWMREKDILPGQDQKLLIKEAVKESNFFLAVTSSKALMERGSAQLELRAALDVLEKTPQNQIFIIPVRVDDCELLGTNLDHLCPVNLFPCYEKGLERIFLVLFPEKRKKPVPYVDRDDLLQPGGAIDINSHFYIKRKEDDKVLNEVKKVRSIVTIRGPRQTGKTSLIQRVYIDLKKSGELRPVIVDFQKFPSVELKSLQEIWKAITLEIEFQLGIEVRNLEYWNPKFSYDQNVSLFLKRFVFMENKNPVLFCFDEVDKIFFSPIKDDFFGSIRFFYNKGAYDLTWKKIHWLLSTSSEPSFFIENIRESPFNIDLRILLNSFTFNETLEFAHRHGLLPDKTTIDRIMTFLGGRPYLLHLFLHNAALHSVPLEKQFNTDDFSIFLDHLGQYLNQFHREPKLATAMQQVISGNDCRDKKLADRLEAAGLARRDRYGHLVCTCSLYADYFTKELK